MPNESLQENHLERLGCLAGGNTSHHLHSPLPFSILRQLAPAKSEQCLDPTMAWVLTRGSWENQTGFAVRGTGQVPYSHLANSNERLVRAPTWTKWRDGLHLHTAWSQVLSVLWVNGHRGREPSWEVLKGLCRRDPLDRTKQPLEQNCGRHPLRGGH